MLVIGGKDNEKHWDMQLFIVKRHRKSMDGTINMEENGRKEDLRGSFLRFSLENRKLLVTLQRVFIVTFCGDNAYLACEGQFYKVKIDGNFFCACEGRNK